MCEPWKQAIIVKTFGAVVGYNFLLPRVRSQWKPLGRMESIDIGDDFFVFRFELLDDFRRALSGGPWFVSQHFLTVRRWEPMFSTTTATTTTTAVWAQLPRLPLDCYESSILEKVGHALGKPLRVDAHTAANSRASFARICVQVDLKRPLVTKLKISKHRQRVQYEGITALCFGCGRIGHRIDECHMKSFTPTTENIAIANPISAPPTTNQVRLAPSPPPVF